MWTKLIGLFAIPIIVYSLGPDMHGIYVVLLLIITHFKFIDLGFGGALVKYLPQFRASGDHDEVQRIARTTMGVNLLAGVVGCALLWWGSSGPLLHFFEKTQDTANVPLLLKMAAITFLVQMASGAPAAALQAAHRFDVHSIVEIVSKGFEIGGFIIILLLGGRLEHLIEFYLLESVLLVIVFFACARKFVPNVSFAPAIFRQTFSRMIGFGIFMTIGRIAFVLTFYFDKLVVLAYVSASAVSHYTVPFQLAALISYIPSMVTNIALPTASELDARGEAERMRRLLVRGMKYIFILTVPVVLLLLLAPEQILKLWINKEYAEKGCEVLLLLTISHTIFSLIYVPIMLVVGMGYIKASTLFLSGSGALNLLLCLFLVPRHGILGAGWASLVSNAVAVPVFLLFSFTLIKPRLADFLEERFPRAVAINVLVGVLLYFSRGLITSRPTLAAYIFVLGILTISFVWIFNVASEDEKDTILGHFRKGS